MKPLAVAIARAGAIASLTSMLALMAAASVEGKAAIRPINATSHWRHGDAAGAVERIDATHTAVGYATHLLATMFWAVVFVGAERVRPRASPVEQVARASLVSVLAAAVDYGATPKRFTPGWELVLTRRGMAFGYAAMAAGFVLARAGRAGAG